MTTNIYLLKCAALAAKAEPESKKEEGLDDGVSPEKPHTVASIAKLDTGLKDLHLHSENPTLRDIAKPY